MVLAVTTPTQRLQSIGRPEGIEPRQRELMAVVHVQASASSAAALKKRSKLEELMERDQAFKKAKADRATNGAAAQPSGRSDAPWLQPGITVKVWANLLVDTIAAMFC